METASRIDENYDLWINFLGTLWEGENSKSNVGKAVDTALGLVKNPEVRAQLSFLVAFGRTFWNKAFNWMRRKDSLTKLDGHSCHEVLIQVFCMESQLSHIADHWRDYPEFAQCKKFTDELDNSILDDSSCLSPRASTLNRYEIFFNEYRKCFNADSGFNRWKTKLTSFVLGSSNQMAVHLFAQHVMKLKQQSTSLQAQHPHPITDENSSTTIASVTATSTNNNLGVSEAGIHDEFSYIDWKAFVSNKCTIDLNDPIITRNIEAIKLLSQDRNLYLWQEEPFEDGSPMHQLQHDMKTIVFTAKHHQQQAEAGVQEVSHCNQNRKSEMISTAFVVVRSYFNQVVTAWQQQEIDGGKELRGNQHMGKGSMKHGHREVKLPQSKRRMARLNDTGQDLQSKAYAGTRKCQLILKCFESNQFPDNDDWKNLFKLIQREVSIEMLMDLLSQRK